MCAGSGDRYSLEDALAAGGLLCAADRRVPANGGGDGGDSGRTARVLYEHFRDDLPAALRTTDNGRRLRAIGLEADVDWCARVSVLDEAALMIDGAVQGRADILSVASRVPKQLFAPGQTCASIPTGNAFQA